MSLKVKQLIGQVYETLRITSDDTSINDRLIIDIINQQRAVDLRNEYNRIRTTDDTCYQVIPCFEMEIVDSSTCCGDVVTGCQILKSKIELPDTIELHQKDGIDSIKPNMITSKNINYVSIDRIPYVGLDDLTKNLLYAFLWNKYLYIYSKSKKQNYLLIDSVTVRGMFSDPFLAGSVGCNGDQCFNYDSEYPISEWMWQSITKNQVISNLSARYLTPRDEDNNAKDDKEEVVMQQKKK